MDTIVERINYILDNPLPQIEYLERSFNAYNFGQDDTANFNTVEQLVRSIATSSDYVGESSITRLLTHENVRRLTVWARDERCLNFRNAFEVMQDDSQRKLQPYELDQIEKATRGQVTLSDITFYFTQLLPCGIAVCSVGLNDRFFVPKSTDIQYDYLNHQYVVIKREVSSHLLEQIVKTWTTEDDVDLSLATVEDMVEVEHGQVLVNNNEYVEFVKVNNDVYYRIHENPVIFTQIFDVDAESKMPVGIYALCRAEEKKLVRIKNAISSRIQAAINASLIVASNTMPAKAINNLYQGKTIVVNEEKFRTDSAQVPFYFPPSKVEEIKEYVLEVERLESIARHLTGLHRQPTEISKTDTSASEAVLVYQNTTETCREIINQFSDIFSKAIHFMAIRDFGIEMDVEVAFNPMDERMRVQFAEKWLPEVIQLIKDDPTAEVLGGLVSIETAQEMAIDLFRANKYSTETIKKRYSTPLDNEEAVLKARAEQKDAATKLAEAEQMKGHADLLNARTNNQKVRVDIAKHNDNITVKLAELGIEASDKNNQFVSGVISSILSAKKAGAERIVPQIPNSKEMKDVTEDKG